MLHEPTGKYEIKSEDSLFEDVALGVVLNNVCKNLYNHYRVSVHVSGLPPRFCDVIC
jgi:hypothetical protein